MKQNYMIIDDFQTRQGYAEYVADKFDGTVTGDTIHFNSPKDDEELRKANHCQAMDYVSLDGVYGFSNLFDPSSVFRSMKMSNLNLTKQGWYELAAIAWENNFLTVVFGFGVMTDTIHNMQDAIRIVIAEMEQVNNEMGVQVNE